MSVLPMTGDLADAGAGSTSIAQGKSCVGQIVREVPILDGRVACGAVADELTRHPETIAIVVLTAEGTYGLVERASYLPRYLDRFNRDLFHRKPITALMDKSPLILDWSTTIERAGMMVAPGAAEAIRSTFIIACGGACIGIGTGVDLMRMVVKEAQMRLQELHRAQDHLVQAQTFASLGRLVAGVAHEINTPIGVSLTAASHMRERVNDLVAMFNDKRLRQSDFTSFTAAAEEASSIVVQNIERAADLIRSFKSVAVDQTTAERRVFNLRQLLDDVTRSLSPALRKSRLGVTIQCPPDLEMDSYPGPLTQVLTNLILNAGIHAFEPGEAGQFVIEAQARDDQVDLRATDNGRGIPPQDLRRIFEPFFTTRRSRGGTGLGLHIAHNIVTQILDGDISCTSTPGEGTTFRLLLPRVAAIKDSGDLAAATKV